MNGISKLFNRLKKLKNKAFRHAYMQEHIRVSVASQIRIIRNKLNISQTQLAESIGTKQSVISRLEDPDSGSVNLNTLLKIAKALDVSLIVKFASFGKFLSEYQDVSPKGLDASCYNEELESVQTQAIILGTNPTLNVSSELIEQNWTKISTSQDQQNTPIYLWHEDIGIVNSLFYDKNEDKVRYQDIFSNFLANNMTETPVYTIQK